MFLYILRMQCSLDGFQRPEVTTASYSHFPIHVGYVAVGDNLASLCEAIFYRSNYISPANDLQQKDLAGDNHSHSAVNPSCPY